MGPASSVSERPDANKLEAIAIEVAAEGARAIRAASGIAVAVGTKSSPTDVVTDLGACLVHSGMAGTRGILAPVTPGP